MMRLQKFLSTAGVCSRRKGEEFIKAGRVKVNGKTVIEQGVQVDPESDRVEVDGKIIRDDQTMIYVMLNKPAGYITSRSHRGEKIVLDLIDVEQRVNPVGRLDKDSTGLLLLTNDGRLHQHLTHPSFDHEKEYTVEVKDPIDDVALGQFREGLLLDGVKTRPASVKRINNRKFRIILKEGKKRQIRRMVEKVGNQVVNLHRIRISTLLLGNLKMGQWRYLSKKEINALKIYSKSIF